MYVTMHPQWQYQWIQTFLSHYRILSHGHGACSTPLDIVSHKRRSMCTVKHLNYFRHNSIYNNNPKHAYLPLLHETGIISSSLELVYNLEVHTPSPQAETPFDWAFDWRTSLPLKSVSVDLKGLATPITYLPPTFWLISRIARIRVYWNEYPPVLS